VNIRNILGISKETKKDFISSRRNKGSEGVEKILNRREIREKLC